MTTSGGTSKGDIVRPIEFLFQHDKVLLFLIRGRAEGIEQVAQFFHVRSGDKNVVLLHHFSFLSFLHSCGRAPLVFDHGAGYRRAEPTPLSTRIARESTGIRTARARIET